MIIFAFHLRNRMTELIETIVEAIADKKGRNVVAIDLSAIDGAAAEAFVVCSADSPAQVEAIVRNVEEQAIERHDEKPRRVEGMTNATWVVMDYYDVMVHIFHTETRAFYKLDELWADAPAKRYEEGNF